MYKRQIGEQVPIPNLVLRLAFRTVLLLLFIAYIIKKDLPLSQIPVINRFITVSYTHLLSRRLQLTAIMVLYLATTH